LFLSLHATATPWIYTLSLHDALPILDGRFAKDGLSAARRSASHSNCFDAGLPHAASWVCSSANRASGSWARRAIGQRQCRQLSRSEEHTSELQSPYDLVCRLLLEKKK